MFSNLFSVELLKTKRSVLWIIALLIPSLATFLGVGNLLVNARAYIEPDANLWVDAWSQVVIFYGMIFFPILVGIYATTICRVDHLNGGWKQVLSFPISHVKLYFANLLTLYLLLAVTQISLVVQYVAIGHLFDLSGTFILKDFVIYGLFGWLASLPLASLQLWLAFNWKSFALPLTVNIGLTIPVLMVSQTPYGFFYPWAQPSMMMSPAYEAFRPPTEQLLIIFSVLLVLFTVLGLLHFRRKEFS